MGDCYDGGTMREFEVRTDLRRALLGDYALPLGIVPGRGAVAPTQGFTVSYTSGEDDEPDTYAFHVVVSHERLPVVLERAFSLLPEDIYGIIEIGSRDAYRSVDVFIGNETVPRRHFLEVWQRFEPFLLEDGTIAAGANSDEPYVEIFLDQLKSLSIHVPLSMREDVEMILRTLGLEEVPQTWPFDEEGRVDVDTRVRPVLALADEYSPDVDEILLQLRHEWNLELNVDPEENRDEGGRELGLTLWHAVVIVDPVDGNPESGAYASVWATARSLTEMQRLIVRALLPYEDWSINEIYTIDRVAHDERPDALGELAPRRTRPEVHLVQIDTWTAEQDGGPGA
jgi:hypothetical protein